MISSSGRKPLQTLDVKISFVSSLVRLGKHAQPACRIPYRRDISSSSSTSAVNSDPPGRLPYRPSPRFKPHISSCHSRSYLLLLTFVVYSPFNRHSLYHLTGVWSRGMGSRARHLPTSEGVGGSGFDFLNTPRFSFCAFVIGSFV